MGIAQIMGIVAGANVTVQHKSAYIATPNYVDVSIDEVTVSRAVMEINCYASGNVGDAGSFMITPEFLNVVDGKSSTVRLTRKTDNSSYGYSIGLQVASW